MEIAVVVLSLLCGPPVPEPGDKSAQVAALIAQLAADDFDTRVEAEEKLAAVGRPAVRPLIRAAAGGDPEVVYRANRVLRKTFDAVDFGAAGVDAPRLVDAAGHREWGTVGEEVKLPDGTSVVRWVVIWLPAEGPELRLAERYGRLVMAARNEVAGLAGTRTGDDPLEGAVQQAATLRYFRDLQVAGVPPWLLKAMAVRLDWLSIPDNEP